MQQVGRTQHFLGEQAESLPARFFRTIQRIVRVGNAGSHVLGQQNTLLPIHQQDKVAVGTELRQGVIVVIRPLEHSGQKTAQSLIVRQISHFPPLCMRRKEFVVAAVLFLHPFGHFRFGSIKSFHFLPA